jgi:hypothetical protein
MSSQLLRTSFKLASTTTASALTRSGVVAAVRPNGVNSLGSGRNSLLLQLQPAAGIATSKKKRDVTVTADKVPGVSRFEEETVVKDKVFGLNSNSLLGLD